MATTEYNCIHCGLLVRKKNTVGKYCSLNCQAEHKVKTNIQDWIDGKRDVRRALIKKWLTDTHGYKCAVCGIDSWNGKPITLWADHIDGNASNNRPENFKLVCPNCDSQQDTFGGKNYGNGRKSRGLKPYS